MSNNPYFQPNMSSDEIYLGQDLSLSLTDEVNNKAVIGHTHSEYASSTHTHSGYATSSDLTLLEDAIDAKANATHTHTEYALSSHSHDGYATVTALDALSEEVDSKANTSHTHTEYALSSHTHDEYAPTSHSHSGYALASHTHDNYASSTHTHSEYSAVGHDHDDDYAAIDHTHNNYATTTALNEVSAAVSGKANASHSHDDVYYTETEVDTLLSGKAASSHTHTDVYDASGAAASALTSANAYTDSKINALVGEGASTTLDTIGEISSAIEDNQDAIDLLNSAIANKANATDLTSHTGNTTIHVTESNKNNWNAAKIHADSAHAPVNAEVNQNAFSNVAVGNTTISADTKTDTLTLVAGNNVTLTPDATGDSITITATNTVYTHPTSAGNKHIPAGGSSGQILRWSADGTAVWGSDNNTTYSNATQTASGLMSDTDKVKLDGISEGANNYVLPSAGTSLGGVKTGGDVTISSGVITVNDDSHNHVISNIDGLQSALNGKAASSHNHDDTYYTETEVDTLISSKANASHTHTIANITNLQTTLDAKASASHTHSVATTSASGLMGANDKEKLDGIASGANAYTHPTYTARTGVPTANATLTHGGTFTVTQPICDATGHITAMNTRTYTLPSDNNTDTKVTNTLATTTKAYITGTTSSTTNTGTQVFDTGVYLDTVAGKLTAATFNGATFSGSGVATVSEVETYLNI